MTSATKFALAYQRLASRYRRRNIDIPQRLWDQLLAHHKADRIFNRPWAWAFPDGSWVEWETNGWALRDSIDPPKQMPTLIPREYLIAQNVNEHVYYIVFMYSIQRWAVRHGPPYSSHYIDGLHTSSLHIPKTTFLTPEAALAAWVSWYVK